jgi:hypothetical protein
MTTKKSMTQLDPEASRALNLDELELVIARVKQAQQTFATYSQEQVDNIFLAKEAMAE